MYCAVLGLTAAPSHSHPSLQRLEDAIGGFTPQGPSGPAGKKSGGAPLSPQEKEKRGGDERRAQRIPCACASSARKELRRLVRSLACRARFSLDRGPVLSFTVLCRWRGNALGPMTIHRLVGFLPPGATPADKEEWEKRPPEKWERMKAYRALTRGLSGLEGIAQYGCG